MLTRLEAKNDYAVEDQQQFNRPTDKSLRGTTTLVRFYIVLQVNNYMWVRL
jgi:hypothetical protein